MQTFLMWSLKPRSQSRTALLKPVFFALLSRNREELVSCEALLFPDYFTHNKFPVTSPELLKA